MTAKTLNGHPGQLWITNVRHTYVTAPDDVSASNFIVLDDDTVFCIIGAVDDEFSDDAAWNDWYDQEWLIMCHRGRLVIRDRQLEITSLCLDDPRTTMA